MIFRKAVTSNTYAGDESYETKASIQSAADVGAAEIRSSGVCRSLISRPINRLIGRFMHQISRTATDGMTTMGDLTPEYTGVVPGPDWSDSKI